MLSNNPDVLKRKVIALRIACAFLASLLIGVGYNNMKIARDNRILIKKIERDMPLEKEIEIINLSERIAELESANEALIKYSEPQSCIKAIQHTSLPKLVTPR